MCGNGSSALEARTARPPPSPNRVSGSSGRSSSAPIPLEDRSLGERDRQAAFGDVVDERAAWRELVELPNESGLGGQVERGGGAFEPPVDRLVLGAVEGELRLSGKVDRVSFRQAPGTRRTSGTSPTQPTTGVGWIERPSVSL